MPDPHLIEAESMQCGLDPIDPTPGPNHPLDVRRRGAPCELEQPGLVPLDDGLGAGVREVGLEAEARAISAERDLPAGIVRNRPGADARLVPATLLPDRLGVEVEVLVAAVPAQAEGMPPFAPGAPFRVRDPAFTPSSFSRIAFVM